MADFLVEAEVRYEAAVARRDAIEGEWRRLGEPLLAVGSTGQLVEHPLMKMLRELDLALVRLAADAKRVHRGPVPSAVLKPAPAARLRSVK